MAEASYNFIYARSPQTRVGVEGFSLHFLSGCEFYPPKTRGFFPPLFSVNLGCFARKVAFFLEPTPQPFEGERD